MILNSSFNRDKKWLSETTEEHRATVVLPLFPNYMNLEFRVEAHNALGKIESEPLTKEADYFGK